MTTAALVNVSVFIADNNIRRNVADFRANAQSADGSVSTRDANIAASGGTLTYTSLPSNSMTVIKVTGGPVTAEINQGSTSFSVVINSLFVISDEFVGLVLTNDGVDPVQVSIIQV
jgi:hypothetical protein